MYIGGDSRASDADTHRMHPGTLGDLERIVPESFVDFPKGAQLRTRLEGGPRGLSWWTLGLHFFPARAMRGGPERRRERAKAEGAESSFDSGLSMRLSGLIAWRALERSAARELQGSTRQAIDF